MQQYLDIARENIRFSSLFGDVSRGTFPATRSEEKRMFSQANVDTGTPKLPGHHRPYWPASKLSFYGERSERPGEGGTPIHYLYGYVPLNGVVILKLLI